MMINFKVKETHVQLNKPIYLEDGSINIDINLHRANLASKDEHPIIDVIVEDCEYDTYRTPITEKVYQDINEELKEQLSMELTDHLQGKDFSTPDEFQTMFIQTIRQILYRDNLSTELKNLEKQANQLLRQEMIDLVMEDIRDILNRPNAKYAYKEYRKVRGMYRYEAIIFYDEETNSIHLAHDNNQERGFRYKIGAVSTLFNSPVFYT